VSGHLLHCVIEDGFGVSWRLECDHERGDFPTIDVDTGTHVSDDCWVPDWWDEEGMEGASGEWPAKVAFPCQVRCEWAGALAMYYDGQPVAWCP
jgi:hypothetical protein